MKVVRVFGIQKQNCQTIKNFFNQAYSSTTYIFDAVTLTWHTTFPLKTARASHSCGVIRTEDNGNYIIGTQCFSDFCRNFVRR
jgi:hypothetical protein